MVVLLAGSSKQAETTVQDLLAPPKAPTGVQGEKAAEAALPDNAAGVQILGASVADPYLLLHLSNGSAALLKGSLDTGEQFTRLVFSITPPIVSGCAAGLHLANGS